MMSYKILITALWFFSASLYAAEVYQWTDAQGKRHYSDKSHENASVYQLEKSISYYKVKKVYDGDTVLLSDGRKIRLLGINTPEVAHSGKVGQVGGDVARKWLTQQILGAKVSLVFDKEKKDKYKRTLAHLFTEQGLHINAELVRLGLASISIFPPNLKYVAELQAAEKVAEKKQRGIWSYPAYQAKPTQALNNNNKQGWQRIVAYVTAIKYTRKSCYLQLSDNFSVRIKKKNWQYFDDLESFVGKKVEFRGWVHRYKKGFSMLLKHPSASHILVGA